MSDHPQAYTEGLSIVIPSYNEAASLPSVVRDTFSVLEQEKIPCEVIVVDDGSTDQTPQVISELKERFPNFKSVRHAVNQGMGSSLNDGYQTASKAYVSFLPADGQIDPRVLPALYRRIQDKDIVTTIYSQREDSWGRKILSKGFRIFLFLLFGPVMPMEGIYLFRRSAFCQMRCVSQTFVFNFEWIIRSQRRGARFAIATIPCRPRMRGRSKVAYGRRIARVVRECWLLRKKMSQQPT